MSGNGILYGVGVGPGDPDLITLRAVKYLGRARMVFAAASTKNDYSRSLEAAGPHLSENAQVVRLGFPMTRDKEELARSWRENAARVAETLRSGLDAAFLTLGDPMLYSTFGYLLEHLRKVMPEAEVRIAPGVTSLQEAAAKSETVLAKSGGTLAVTSGLTDMKRFKALANAADATVMLKVYRNFEEIKTTVAELGRSGDAVFATRLGMPGETVVRGLDDIRETPHYLSLLILPGGERDE
jgi:precorrin-2/cobalt-factor-2 C20-methyltransferase